MRPHVHCYKQYPPASSRDIEHCVRDDVVLGPDDTLVIENKTYHPLVVFVGNTLVVKRDPTYAQIATRLHEEPAGKTLDAKQLVDAGQHPSRWPGAV